MFRTAAEKWLVEQEKEVEASTYNNYSAPFRRILERFGDKRVDSITPAMVKQFIDEIAAQGYCKNRVDQHLTILRGAFRAAITMPETPIQYNPCDNVKIPSSCKNGKRDLPPKYAVDAIKDGLDLDFGLFPFLLVYTGLRKGEALALTDKDFKDGFIHVTKAVKHIGGKTIIGDPKSEAGVRQVIILEPLKKALPKWKGYLFSVDGGKSPLTKSQFQKLWDKYAVAAGIAQEERATRHRPDGRAFQYTKIVHDICCHQLRHEFATLCFDAGLDPMDAADMLGHSDDRITKEIYTHIRDSRREKSYSKLQEYVNSNY